MVQSRRLSLVYSYANLTVCNKHYIVIDGCISHKPSLASTSHWDPLPTIVGYSPEGGGNVSFGKMVRCLIWDTRKNLKLRLKNRHKYRLNSWPIRARRINLFGLITGEICQVIIESWLVVSASKCILPGWCIRDMQPLSNFNVGNDMLCRYVHLYPQPWIMVEDIK